MNKMMKAKNGNELFSFRNEKMTFFTNNLNLYYKFSILMIFVFSLIILMYVLHLLLKEKTEIIQ